jgi:hypothetical protein
VLEFWLAAVSKVSSVSALKNGPCMALTPLYPYEFNENKVP